MSVSYKCAITGHSPPYLFDIPHADLPERALTVHDLLEHAAQYHDIDCGCNLKVGTRVWRSPIPLSEIVGCDWEPLSSDALAIDASLDSLRVDTESSNVHLVIAGGHPPCQDHLRRYREKIFVPYLVNDARVFKRAGAEPALPPRTSTGFDALCAVPGSTVVDKSAPLHSLLCKISSKRVGIIRRPKGFGKTTLLSMFAAFFDPLSVHAHLPFTFTGDMSASTIFEEHGQLLVFALDFADLAFKRDMCRDDLEAECDRFMNAAALNFYVRYKGLLRVREAETSHPGFTPTFLHVIRWAKSEGWKLCLTIDNYTAPVLDDDSFVYKWIISEEIFTRLSHLVLSSFVLYGLIVGDEAPHATEWPEMPKIFTDLTDAPAFAQAIGFTVDEVVALGHAISADLIGALPSGTPTGRFARRVYAAADIMALARSVTIAGGPHEPAPTKVRTFKHPPPVKSKELPGKTAGPARRKQARLEESRYVVKLWDAFDNGDGPPDDAPGDEGTGDSSLDVPELSDGSSGGSSSGSSDSSSDGRSSAPSSGGDKNRILLPVHDEPASPLERYAKKPWVSDTL